MKKSINAANMILLGFLLLFITGCSSFVTFDNRKMSVDDVISLSKINLDTDVIILQIKSTYSKYRLDTAEILRLKTEGVDDEVIKYMIETTHAPERFSWEYRESPINDSYYNFNQSEEVYDYNKRPYGDRNRIYPYVSPYSHPVNIQTDYFRRSSPYYGRRMLYDSRLFENKNSKKIRRPGN
ncbi:hypothetical protein ACFL2X_04020 [Candidatus Latescibacterota bacterium]